jgi:hypothetical protein
MNDMKLLVRDEDGLENEIKNLRAFATDINTTFVFLKFAIYDNNVTYSTIVYQLLNLC